MGFWKDLWSDIKQDCKEAVRYVGKKLQETGKWIEKKIEGLGKKDKTPDFNYSNSGIANKNNTINEEKDKENTILESNEIANFQKHTKKKASRRENNIKNVYLSIYENYISYFSEVFDKEIIDSIDSYVKEKSESFKNTMRNEVNAKVNPSYYQWKQLLSSLPTGDQVQAYCNKVYTEADNNLLDLLQKTIEETNKYIRSCINKYNNDKALALSRMKESLINLTADEETKAKELKQIAEELAVAEFIANEATPIQ